MKKKISVFTLLFSLIIALFVPVQVNAKDSDYDGGIRYDKTTFTINCTRYGNVYNIPQEGLNMLNNGADILIAGFTDTDWDSVEKTEYIYVLIYDSDYEIGTYLTGYRYFYLMDNNTVFTSDPGNYILFKYSYSYDYDKLYLENTYYSWSVGKNLSFGYGCGYSGYYLNDFIYCSDDVYELDNYQNTCLAPTGNISFYAPKYSFSDWCTNAGLNCAASSYESDSVIPFWYEPDYYNYIVSKNLISSTTSGVYNLLMIQKSDGAHYPYHFKLGDIDYLGIAGAFADISMFTVRKFYYDSDGEGWKLIMRHDISELPFDHTDFTFDENTVFIFSDTDIYADRAASSVWQPASTGYYNVDVPELDVPTPTPTSIPSSGGGRPGSGTRPDTGGLATGGGGLDFIINLFTMIWTKICSIPMAVDGYSISLQQIIVYGALVSIVGGFIMHFIFGRK